MDRTAADRTLLLRSLAAGQIAGAVFLGYLVLAFAAFRDPPGALEPMRIAGASLLGRAAFAGPSGVLAGVLANQLVAAAWSGCFAFLVARLPVPLRHGPILTVACLVAAAAVVVDVYLLSPPLTMVLHGADFWWTGVPWFWSWSAHAAYGLALGFFFLVGRPTASLRASRATT